MNVQCTVDICNLFLPSISPFFSLLPFLPYLNPVFPVGKKMLQSATIDQRGYDVLPLQAKHCYVTTRI